MAKASQGTFLGIGEPAYPILLAQLPELLAATREQLMDITLMSHIEDYFIPGAIIYRMQSHGQFHRAEVRSEMSAAVADHGDDIIPEFQAKQLELFDTQTPKIFGVVYPFEQILCFSLHPAHS